MWKVVIIGEGRVGKTSMTLRYINDQFDDGQVSTINASYLEKVVETDNGSKQKIAIWDTAGQEMYRAMAPLYYRDALAAVIVYDITYRESFDKVKTWILELKQYAGQDIKIYIAGNKCDLENSRQINNAEAEQFAKRLNAYHTQTSAKANKGIEELFQQIVKDLSGKSSKQETKSTKPRVKKKGIKIGGEVNNNIDDVTTRKEHNQKESDDEDEVEKVFEKENNKYNEKQSNKKEKKGGDHQEKSSKKKDKEKEKSNSHKLSSKKNSEAKKKGGCC